MNAPNDLFCIQATGYTLDRIVNVPTILLKEVNENSNFKLQILHKYYLEFTRFTFTRLKSV